MYKRQSLPRYYGYYSLAWFAAPSLLIIFLWLLFSESFVTNQVISSLPESIRALSPNEITLRMNDVKNLAAGNLIAGESFIGLEQAAANYNRITKLVQDVAIYSSLVLSLALFIFSYRSISGTLRARNKVEKIISNLLLASATCLLYTSPSPRD